MSRAAESVNLELLGVTVDFDYSNRLRAAIVRDDNCHRRAAECRVGLAFDLKPFPPVSSASPRCILTPLLNKRQLN